MARNGWRAGAVWLRLLLSELRVSLRVAEYVFLTSFRLATIHVFWGFPRKILTERQWHQVKQSKRTFAEIFFWDRGTAAACAKNMWACLR